MLSIGITETYLKNLYERCVKFAAQYRKDGRDDLAYEYALKATDAMRDLARMGAK